MGGLGWAEILMILVVALIIFGPRKLPELGKSLGQSLAQFRRASEDFKRTWEDEVETEKRRIQSYMPDLNAPVTNETVPYDYGSTASQPENAEPYNHSDIAADETQSIAPEPSAADVSGSDDSSINAVVVESEPQAAGSESGEQQSQKA